MKVESRYTRVFKMKSIIKSIAFLVILTLLIQCGKRQAGNVVEVTISGLPNTLTEVKIVRMSMLSLDDVPLASGKPDSTGSCTLKFTVAKNTFAMLNIGKYAHSFYLQPGYVLKARLSNKGDTIQFSGIGAEPNNYLADAYLEQQAIEKRGGVNMYDMDPIEALPRVDTIEQIQSTLLQHYIDSLEFDDDLASMLKTKNKLRVLMLKQSLAFSYAARHQFDIPPILDISEKIPYDSTLLDIGLSEYALITHINMVIKDYRMKFDSISDQSRPVIINKDIQESNYSKTFREFLCAKSIDFQMAFSGLNTSIDSLYHGFINVYPGSPYRQEMENHYNRLIAIEPGHTAPEIKGLSSHGDTISSIDFHQKVVYVDVWASWCGPCVAEIPFSIKLQDKFKNDDVVFLNVSVDARKTDWDKALNKYKNWGGTHINDLSIYQTYNVKSIPRYILIDKNGKVVSNNADRPSEKDIEKEIQKLL